MELRDLNYFRVLATHGHVGRAAESLGLSQPALTKSLKRLEAEIGARLFERTARGVRLTSVGAAFRARAVQIRVAIEQTLREAADLATGKAGHLRVGTGPTMSEYLLPAVCQKLLNEAPELSLKVVIGMNDVLLAAIEGGELDLIFATLPDRRSEGFVYETLMEDELAVVVRRAHPLVRRRHIQIADLAGQRWALPAATVLSRQGLEKVFAERSLPAPRVMVETNSIALLLATIARTDLLGLQPRRALRASTLQSELRELRVPSLAIHRRIGLIHRNDAYLPPASERFMQMLRAMAAKTEQTPGR